MRLRLGGIAPKVYDIGRAIEVRRNLNEHLSGCLVDSLFIHALALPLELNAGVVEGKLRKLTDRMLLAGCDDEILRLLVLQNQPHALDIVLCVAPVAERGQVSKIKLVLQSLCNSGCCKGYFSCNKGLASAFGFVIEQNSGAGKHAVGFPIFLDDPVAVLLRDGIRAVGMERSCLALRDLLHLAEKLRGGRLIDAAGILQAAQADCFQNTQNSDGIHVCRELRNVEGNLNVGLRREVVDFIRANLADNLHHAHRIAEVSVMEMEVRIVLQMRDSLAVIHGGTADDSVYFISLFQKELRKVGSVLSGNAGDQSCLCHSFSPLSCCLSVMVLLLPQSQRVSKSRNRQELLLFHLLLVQS